ncbi:F-box/kelch-repeat protein At3g23880-like [Lotus japonicus]|uniref:F-box/kelch-repeat protein At3g23880-like n=1 Tax=Lotus japonicus TaxID=34305 RepID=UPI00258439A4|nr:F-box/kelch-repeat protein At3g23880-like [Lotus japonicus]
MENEKEKSLTTLPLPSLSATDRSDMENQNEKNPSLPHESLSAAEPSNVAKENENEKNLTLPTELIFEILLRLPVKSLLPLKRVCKSWSSIISDPQFAKSHFDLNAAPTDRLILRFLDEDGNRVESFDLASSLDDRVTVKTHHVPSPSMWCNHNPLHYLGSCRGFMLLAYEHTGDVIVWNPTTGFDKQVPDIDLGFMFSYLCGFGYESSTDDYFIVVITLYRSFLPETQMRCFSLKSDSWCDTRYVNVHYMDYGHDSKHGVFLNDSLHWLVIYKDSKLPVVIAFDLGKKSLLEILLPPELAMKLTRKVYYLRVLGGCLSLCYSGGRGWHERAEIWVMKEKVQSSWTKAFVMTNSCDVPCNHFYPLCFNERGRVVGTNGRGRLIKFNAKGIVLEHLKYNREYKHVQKYFEMYRESLLFFPGEERFYCVTEDEGSEDAEKKTIEDEEATVGEEAKATEDEYASEDEYATEDEYDSEEEYSTDEEYSTGDEYATEDEEEEATDDEDGIEEDETTDDEEEN